MKWSDDKENKPGKWKVTSVVALIGAVFGLWMALFTKNQLNGPIANQAIQIAKTKAGPNFSYAATAIQLTYTSGKTTANVDVAAYDDNSIQILPIEFEVKP